jgi:DNA-binding transcriptional LysR family regulator
MEFDHLSNGWLGIELRHFAALREVASTGGFRAAAQRLGYTQSAVSQQIATLERLVGAKLVERPGGPRSVHLTEAGELLLRHADAIVARLQAAQADVAALLEGGAGTLRVGTFQSTGARILPRLLQRFSGDWPGVDVRLTESANDPDLLASVERGELDLSFAMLPLPEGPFEIVELTRDPWVLLVAADAPLAERGTPVRSREVVALPLIGARLCRSRTQLDAYFHSAGLAPNYVFHSDDNSTVHALVAAGVGAALLPELCVDRNDDRVVALDLSPSPPPRVIAIAWHRDRYRPPVAEAFVEAAIAVCEELDDPALAATA